MTAFNTFHRFSHMSNISFKLQINVKFAKIYSFICEHNDHEQHELYLDQQ